MTPDRDILPLAPQLTRSGRMLRNLKSLNILFVNELCTYRLCCDSSDSVRSICNSLLIKVNRQGSNTSEDSVAGQARRRREPGKRSGAGSRRHEFQKTGRRSVGRQQTIKG